MKTIILILLAGFLIQDTNLPDANKILDNVDENMYADSRIFNATMVVHGRRGNRTITLRGWSEGDDRSLTEYMSPPREQGTKMLKLEDNLWIYTPSSDRTIQISGHMLKQSVMGSDLSYEDMMEERELTEMYKATVIEEVQLEGRQCWILELTAKVEDVAYQSRKIWIDVDRYVPLKEELFAKSGQLLKETTFSNVELIEGRWYPKTIVFKDMLKDGNGTEFTVDNLQFNVKIDDYIFSKAALKK